MRVDALIIGAGPAGSAAARLLAQAGWQVALAEKTEFPRRKVCGEFISATTMPVLEACGIADDFAAAAGPAVTRIGAWAGATMLVAPQEKVWGRALGREHLDMMLRDAAVKSGAILLQPAEVTSLTPDEGLYRCALADGREIAAGIVIAACGSWNAKGAFAVRGRAAAPSDLFAFKAHFKGAHLSAGLMPLLAFPGGYGGLVESDGGRVSLSCCIRRDALAAARARHAAKAGANKAGEGVLAHILESTKGAWLALRDAAVESSILSTGPIQPGIRACRKDGIYYTGNIAGEAHPVIAEGISMAIQSSGLLARLLIAGRGEAYAGEWQRHFAPRIRAASLFAHLAMSDTGRMAGLALLRAAPRLLDLGARISGKRPAAA